MFSPGFFYHFYAPILPLKNVISADVYMYYLYGVLVYATLIGWIQKKTSELMRPNYSCWHPLGIACHHFLAPEHDTTDHTRMCPGIADTTHSSSGAV